MKLNIDLKLSTVWVNLAAPTHLRNIHYDEVHSLNLVNVLVPAIGCWLAPVYDFIATVNYFINNDITWKRSVLACFMGQGLPEQMVKKVLTLYTVFVPFYCVSFNTKLTLNIKHDVFLGSLGPWYLLEQRKCSRRIGVNQFLCMHREEFFQVPHFEVTVLFSH